MTMSQTPTRQTLSTASGFTRTTGNEKIDASTVSFDLMGTPERGYKLQWSIQCGAPRKRTTTRTPLFTEDEILKAKATVMAFVKRNYGSWYKPSLIHVYVD